MEMITVLIYGMIYLGSALMLYNICRYTAFSRSIRERGDWREERGTLNLPIVLLILFLCGYLGVGIFGNPDLLVSAILFGGSIFVAVILQVIRRIASRIQENEQLEARLTAAERRTRQNRFSCPTCPTTSARP